MPTCILFSINDDNYFSSNDVMFPEVEKCSDDTHVEVYQFCLFIDVIVTVNLVIVNFSC